MLPPPPAQDFAFSHFSRQYVSTVLQYRGVNKDLYHNLWQKVVSFHAPACLQFIVRNHNSRHGAVVHNCSPHLVAPLAPPWLR